jgi:DNA modification methylase
MKMFIGSEKSNLGSRTFQSYLSTLANSDCLDFLKTVPDASVDLVLVDPPYFIGYDGGTGWDSQWKSEAEYLDWCSAWTEECFRVLKPNRMMIVWGTTKTDTFYRYKLDVLNKISGFVSQTPIIWSYNWGGRTKKNFSHKHETAWCYSKGKDFLFNAVTVERKMKVNLRTGLPYDNGTIPTNIWEGNLATTSKEAKDSKFHPTVKPQFVLERIITAYTNVGDVVLDCFSGSGSTMIACEMTERKFVGSEISSDYYEKSIERRNGSVHSTLLSVL